MSFADFGGNPAWLILAMEVVEPLHDLIARRSTDGTHALKVLRGLALKQCDGWFHYDICPKNCAIRDDGTVTFIDPDSYFPLTEENPLDVSIGAAKLWRVPPWLAKECRNPNTPLGRDTVAQKHGTELILLAAECCLGLFNESFEREALAIWCSGSNAHPEIKTFWQHELQQLCDRVTPAPSRIAADLEALLLRLDDESQAKGADHQPDINVTRDRRADPLDFSEMTSWTDFLRARRLMRERALDQDELERYRERLWQRAREEPNKREWWAELLMLTMTFAVDLHEARRAAQAALEVFPEDEEFRHDELIVNRWRHARG